MPLEKIEIIHVKCLLFSVGSLGYYARGHPQTSPSPGLSLSHDQTQAREKPYYLANATLVPQNIGTENNDNVNQNFRKVLGVILVHHLLEGRSQPVCLSGLTSSDDRDR